MCEVTDHLQNKIKELVESKVNLIMYTIPIENSFFTSSHKKAKESPNAIENDTAKFLEQMGEIGFKIKSIDWELNKALNDLQKLMKPDAYESFRFSKLDQYSLSLYKNFLQVD